MTESEKDRGVIVRQWRAYLVASAVTAFAANLVWEMTQMRAYREMDAKPWWETLGTCTAAAGADVLLTLIPYGVGAMISRKARWAWSGGAKTYCTLAVLGFLTAVAGERVGLALREWSYNELMPMIPSLNVGVWPVLQLTTLVPLSFAVGNLVRHRIA